MVAAPPVTDSIKRGQTVIFDYVPRDVDGNLVAQGAVSNAWFYVKASKADADALAILKKTYSPSAGITWVTNAKDSANNLAPFPGFRVKIAWTDFDGLTEISLPNTFAFEMKYKDTAGDGHSLEEGSLWVEGDVVQARV